MRVLCISTDFPPQGGGGYELQCAGWVEHLRRRGHDVRVLVGGRDLPRFPALARPCPRERAGREDRRARAALRRHLREHDSDAVALWRLGELSMSLVEEVRRADLPAVGMVCDPWMIEGPRRDPWARLAGAPRFAGAARWLFVSEALHRQVSEAGVDVGAATVVPWGVELGELALAPARPWRGRLLYAGRLSRLKGVDLAVRALAGLPGCTLDVVGDGPALPELRQLATALDVADRVRFHGHRPRAAVRAAYAHADAVLFPVRWAEPFGVVPLEAMARGTPVVATATGGSAEFLLDGRTALVVPPEDPTAIARAVTRLAARPGLRARLRRAGREMAERYPASRSHARVREVLEAAVRKKDTSSSA